MKIWLIIQLMQMEKTSGNIIDTVGKFNPGGEESKEVDVTKITVDAILQI